MAVAFERSSGACITTLLVRGVPRKYSAWDVVSELDAIMSRQAYDFVYVPRKRNAPANMGFAFLNFVSPSAAEAAVARLSGRQWTEARIVNVSVADVQGLSDNLRRFRNAMGYLLGKELAHAPLVFKRGEPVPIEVALGRRFAAGAAAAAEHPAACAFKANAFVNATVFEARHGLICEDVTDARSSYSATCVPSSPQSSGASSARDVHDSLLDSVFSAAVPSESSASDYGLPVSFVPLPGLLPPAGLSFAPQTIRESWRTPCPEPPYIVLQRFSF